MISSWKLSSYYPLMIMYTINIHNIIQGIHTSFLKPLTPISAVEIGVMVPIGSTAILVCGVFDITPQHFFIVRLDS